MAIINKALALVDDNNISIPKMRKNLKEYDKTIEKFIKGVIRNNWHLILSGEPGTGKTQMATELLTHSKKSVSGIKGVTSAIGLYRFLYENNDKIILVDDSDNLFDSVEATEILKAAMDSKTQRKISWQKQNTNLEKFGIPNNFVFTGRIIIISNKDFEGTGDRKTKAQKLMAPVLDRVVYFKVGMPSRKWQIEYLRMLHQDNKIKVFADKKIPRKIQDEMIDFIADNSDHFFYISFRTLVKMCDFYHSDKSDWRNLTLMSQ